MDRRTFVRTVSAGVVGATLYDTRAMAAPLGRVAPSDQISLGIIGAGSQGKTVLRDLLRIPGVKATAICDVYSPRFAEARELTGADTPVWTDYRKMLDDMHGKLDAVLVATPLYLHHEHVVAALEAGCHVYGEKSMAYTPEGCEKIVDAVRRTRKSYQVGHQYRYAPWAREAIRRIHAGEIGEVTHIFGYWHRNNNWRRAVPKTAVDGRGPAELERLINWRLYRQYSRGLVAELGSHQIDFANWIFGAHPTAVVGTGGIVAFRDGRETFDNIQATYEYPGGRLLHFSSLLNNARTGYQVVVMGTGGTVELTFDDATIYFEPMRPQSAVPQDGRNRPKLAEAETVTTGATKPVSGDRPYRGPGEKVVAEGEGMSAGLLAAGNFIQALRDGERPWTDENVGRASATAVAFGDEATRKGGRVEFGRALADVPPPSTSR